MSPGSASKVEIRDARPDEYDALGEIIGNSYEEYAPGPDGDPEFRAVFEGYRHELRDVRSRLEFSEQIVALLDGKLVAGVSYYPGGKIHYENAQVKIPSDWTGIRLLGVDPSARGHGIGKALTEECLRRSRAAGAPVVLLHTTMLMELARGMYVRMGFARAPEFDFKPTPDFLVEAYTLLL